MTSVGGAVWLGGRLALLAVLAAVTVVGLPQHAAAHTRAAAASNYESRIVDQPAIDGVTWQTYAGGDLVEVVNHGGQELVVLGYEGEPYLRVGPDGVFENLNSPATYLNADRDADVATPPRADPDAAPEWRRVNGERSRAWHDHRVHWMAPDPPREVQLDPTRNLLITRWSVPFEHGGERHELGGELRWVPGEPAWPWLGIAIVLTAAAMIGLRAGHSDVRTLIRPAAAVVAVTAAINLVHLPDEVLAWPAPTLDVVFGLFHTILFVGVGLVGALIAWHGRQGPLLSLGIASGAVLFHQGLLQLRLLTSSQLPSVWPSPVLRFAVAMSVAQAVWVALVIARGLRGAATTGTKDPEEGVRRSPQEVQTHA